MKKIWLTVGALLFVIFIVVMVILARQEQTAPSAIEKAFLPYAQELQLDTKQFIADMKSDTIAAIVNADRSAGEKLGIQETPTFFINGVRERFRSQEELERLIETYRQKNEVQTIPEHVHVKGAQNPTVLITEYSDFECPACGLYAPIVASTVAQNSTDTALVYKHFPLVSLHPMALPAARATEAAAQQGKFWEMHDLLFAHQREWN